MNKNRVHLPIIMRPTNLSEQSCRGQPPQKEGLQWSNTKLTHVDFNSN